MIVKRHILANALHIAADQYADDARVHGDPSQTPGYETPQGRQRIVAEFARQACEARKLADDIEQAATITLED